ncbi:MAG: adenylosuccinate synthase [Cryomorphaceae bacterium]|nr:MAG: adenylosuccinate synthase [Cryomorphaceae bacterium]
MKADVLLGLQWGDEGKGKIVDVLTPNYEIIARFQGGPNAGHTLEFNGIKHVLHTIPSGVFRDTTMNVIGNGVVIDPIILKKEIEALIQYDVPVFKNILISRKAHLILPTHRILDAANEHQKGKMKIGSTLKGIGPTYMDKTGRNGLRIGDILKPNFREIYDHLVSKHEHMLAQFDFDYDLAPMQQEWLESIEFLKKMTIIDSEHYLNNALKSGKSILAEGAQGSLLDIDFGTYPYVTSSNTLCSGACSGLGIAPNRIQEVFGIFKAYCTRVGSGPFPTELHDNTGELMRKVGHEFGATTGRPRRCGWLDLPALKYAIMINGVTQLLMTKADVLSVFENIKVCTAYEINGEVVEYFPYDINIEGIKPVYKELHGWSEDLTAMNQWEQLPSELIDYIAFIESETGVPVRIVSVGPDRSQTILRETVSA